ARAVFISAVIVPSVTTVKADPPTSQPIAVASSSSLTYDMRPGNWKTEYCASVVGRSNVVLLFSSSTLSQTLITPPGTR
ncbi:hypothetical protein GDO81_027466, partial [Engystomops pustulosus]